MGTRGKDANQNKGPETPAAQDSAKNPPAAPPVAASSASAAKSPAGPKPIAAPAAKPVQPSAAKLQATLGVAPATKAPAKPSGTAPSSVATRPTTVPVIPPVSQPAPKPDSQPGGFMGAKPSPAPYAAIRTDQSAGGAGTPGTVRKDVGPTPASLPGWNREFGDSPANPVKPASPAPVANKPAPPRPIPPKPVAPAQASPPTASAAPATAPTGISAAAISGAISQPPTPAAPAPEPTQPTPAALADAERDALAKGKSPIPEPASSAAGTAAPTADRLMPPPAPFEVNGSAVSALPSPQADSPAVDESPRPEATQPPLLFEIAWEVCWQLGGIYTVLRSKAQAMIDRWGDRYCLIGPYNPATAVIEFEEQQTYGPIRDAMNRLRDMGIPCYFGRWMITGRPRVLLIDYRARFNNLHNDKFAMWNDHKIELPADDGEVNEVVAFGFVVTEFFRLLANVVKDRPILAHFHEWMGGVAVPRIAHLRLPVATVFTTHATLLGRYLAGDNPYFYDHLQFLDPDKEAAKYNIYPRFAIERAAAHSSTVFTTVSDVTGVEAEKLLGRTPDMIVPNGINLHKFAAPHEFQHLHAKYKEKINEFVMGHFFPSYSFDLDRTLYVFTSGRYEYRNKGMDMFIEALHRLNWRLKGTQNPPTIVAFVITRAPTRNINVRVLQNQSMYEDLRHTCTDIQQQMGNRLLGCVARGTLPSANDLLKEDEQVRLKRAMHAWKSHSQPLIVTHDLADDAADPVLRHFRHRNMFNAADDPVKVVFHPDFLSATNPVMALDYEQFVRGTHMGVFPSYYEPWGYTPLECMALGVPAVTSDLAGFGSYVQKHVYPRERRDADRQGIHIINRRGKSFEEACEALVNHLFSFSQLTRRQRIEMRNRTERISEQFDWSTLSRHYDDAHNLALERVGSKRVGQLEVRMI